MMKRQNVEYVLQYGHVTPFIWDKGKFRCFYCTEHMKDPDQLREHSRTAHQFANLELVIFDRTKNRNKDAAVKIDITDIYCKLCSQTVSSLDQLIHHLIIAHDAQYDMSVSNCLLPFRLNKNQPTCAICDMTFSFFEYLLRHANKYHLSHDYMCDVCGTSFQGENHLKMHHRYYHREGGYDCEKCGVSLLTLSQKLLHEKNVHMQKLETCHICPETFKSPYVKKLHLANVHGVEEMKIKCPYCPKVFPQRSIMSRHMRRVHLKEKNVECKVCKERFFGPYDVKLHMARHSGVKNFVCNECGKKFAKKSNLNAHIMAVHAVNDKKLSCEHCNKSFSYQANLNHHVKTQHSASIPLFKKVSCEQCNIEFNDVSSLNDHFKQHLPVNEYLDGIMAPEVQNSEILEVAAEEQISEILELEFVADEFSIDQTGFVAQYAQTVAGDSDVKM